MSGEPLLWEPPCAAQNCPLHPKTVAATPPRRRSPARSAGSAVETGAPVPRLSKLAVSNERNRKLLAKRVG